MLKNLFILIFLSHCFNALAQENVYSLIWDQNQVRSIIVNKSIDHVKVRLKGRETFILGKSTLTESGIRFEPLIPFTNGLIYEVVNENSALFSFTPKPNTSPPTILNIYPQSNILPENFLKFYIEFDQPMGIGKLYDHIHLYINEKEVKGAFLRLQPELWNESNQMVTIWIDPGRIKTDLGPHIYQGPVLEAGNQYQLRLDTGIMSASGQFLKYEVSKDFQVIPRDSQQPNINKWTMTIPSAKTKQPLIISMNEKMDYAIVDHVQILNSKASIQGAFDLKYDSVLTFKPANLWPKGEFEIQVEAITEDLSGNNLDRLFEVDRSQTTDSTAANHSLKFIIR